MHIEVLKCKVCVRIYRLLGSHLWHAHKIRARDYKMKYGLNINHPLITDEIRMKNQ